MRTLRLVARFGCFDRTYEGLKPATGEVPPERSPRFDRTYEGLKQHVQDLGGGQHGF